MDNFSDMDSGFMALFDHYWWFSKRKDEQH